MHGALIAARLLDQRPLALWERCAATSSCLWRRGGGAPHVVAQMQGGSTRGGGTLGGSTLSADLPVREVDVALIWWLEGARSAFEVLRLIQQPPLLKFQVVSG